jgi:hypothetical protein
MYVLKEHSFPASVLEGEGGVYCIIFLAHGRFEIWRNVRLMDFWPEGPASGVEKWISGFFRAIIVETRNPLFYTREQFLRPGERLAHFFYAQNAPYHNLPLNSPLVPGGGQLVLGCACLTKKVQSP